MTSSLFRPEVMQHRRDGELGTIRLPAMRLGAPAGALAAAVLLAMAATLAFAGHVRKERVQGRLIPASGLIALTAPRSGTVITVEVREGDRVAAGQALLQIGAERTLRDGELGAALDARIGEQRRSLDSDLAMIERNAALDRAASRAQMALLQRQIDLAVRRQVAYREQAGKARAMLERMRPLRDSQVVSALQMQQYEADALNQESLAQSAEQESLSLLGQRDTLRHGLHARPAELAQQRSKIRRELAELDKARLGNEAERARVVRAPVAGRVAGLSADVGQSVSQNGRLLTLVPDKSRLLAELWLPDRARGGLRIGTEAVIRYDAYPYQRYGQHRGRVIEVSNAAVPPEEVLARTGLRVDAPRYRVLARLLPPPREASAIDPLPMMSLQADLLLEKVPLYRWLSPQPPSPRPDTERTAAR